MENPKKPILPEAGKRNIMITSALPYVNNVPHLGNLIGCVLSGDVYARYCRLRGHNVAYICGTDEYGTATETKALEKGITPQALCDEFHHLHKDIYDWFNIQFTFFGRTSKPASSEITQDIFLKLLKNGNILEKATEQQYCEKCQRFLADRYVEGQCPHCKAEGANGDQCDKCQKLLEPTELLNPQCSICKHKPVKRTTTHAYIDLSKLQGKLEEWVEKSNSEGHWTANSLSVTRAWIKTGLEPRCITRDLKWGVPVPTDRFPPEHKELAAKLEGKVFYVWFDAPIGYISITATYTPDWEKWWKNPDQVKLVQFMGKDNIPFHTVMFPCSLLGTGDPYLKLHHVSTTDYLTYEGLKFSKRNGIGVFGNDTRTTGIPSDVWRWYLLANRPETGDANFTWSDLQAKNNSELLGKLGNFVNRALKFVEASYKGEVPALGTQTEKDKTFVAQVQKELTEYIALLDAVHIRDPTRVIMSIAALGNGYLQDEQPWVLIKSNPERCATVINLSVQLSKLLGTLLNPYAPDVCHRILAQLNSPLGVIHDTFTFEIKDGHKIGTPEPLFQTLDNELIATLHKRFTPSTFVWDMRVGKVLSVADHPSADKLYLVTVDLGREKRTVVAGLKESHKKEQLEGQVVTVLCNLKAANFQGQQSNGMILVAAPPAGGAGAVQLLQVQGDVPLGTQVIPKGFQLGVKPNLDFRKDFQKEKFLTDKEGRAEFVDRDTDAKTKVTTERRVLLVCRGLNESPAAKVSVDHIIR
eukprot:Mycagemm_TRINITY_DN10272_c0_g1::TRINITY_DN10272_c0_g1_i2::g.3962::m.3962 type:complete len:754 gc:universal TRINITY_DN10272_c0_g1_i2:76-2337(+)